MQINQDNVTWRQSLGNLITDVDELLASLGLDHMPNISPEAKAQFPLRVSREFVARMSTGNPQDPLLLQVLPILQELDIMPGYSHDALMESKYNPVPGLIHKYQSRVLVTVTGACAINCRFCFRRHFPYADNTPGRGAWQAMIDYVAKDPSINEIIFSGGDPLVAKDTFLADLANQFATIPHIKRLRIHSRLPIIIPQRLNDEFLTWMTALPLQTILVTHCNHPQEIDLSVTQALKRCANQNITLLNQTVLLKGINDNADTLATLSESLFSAQTLPYYLHVLDKVQGAAHFDIPEAKAQHLIGQLQKKLPGFLVPKLVKEVPGQQSKLQLIPKRVKSTTQ